MALLRLAASATLLSLLLFVGASSAAKVGMKTADCNLLALKPTWTNISSCKTPRMCTVYKPAVNFDDQYEGLATFLCSAAGDVVYIYLSYFQDDDSGNFNPDLSGPLPSEWSKFSKVQTIFIYSENLRGVLPWRWGDMKALKSLTITSPDGGGSYLTGGIPSHWGALRNLELLDLSGNEQLSGRLPSTLGLLKKLKTLNLAANSFSGTLTASLGQLSALQYLYLSDNKFSGNPAAVLGKLSKTLVELQLQNNGFTGRLPVALAKAKKLTRINFRNNNFGGRLPPEWKSMTELSELDLQSNKGLFGGFPSSWSTLPNLAFLYIGGTGIRGSVAPFKNYRFIFLYIYPATQICGDIPSDRFRVTLWNFGAAVTKLPKCK